MTEPRSIHIIGAGMAGLSAALQMSLMGEKVTVYESAQVAGGRCRSYFDRGIDCRIDNGNHLVLSGNVAVHEYIELTGAQDTFHKPSEPLFPFMDVETGERWTLRMNQGRMPWWIFDRKRNIPGVKPSDYLSALRFMLASEEDTVADKVDPESMIFKRLWNPLAIAALNTELDNASASLMGNVIAQTFTAGGAACIPMVPKVGMSESFVLPCLNVLQEKGCEIKYGCRLRAMDRDESGKIVRLHFNDGGAAVELGPRDWVILAVPAWVAKELIPDLPTPTEFRSIANVHYRIEAPQNPAHFTGLIGGLAEWVFVRNGVVSVTISAADRYDEPDNEKWAVYVWKDLAKLFDLDPVKVPPCRVVREKRATFAATPDQDKLRPSAYIGWDNLALAGDWTATELPSTIEGALRSGVKAAQVVLRWGQEV